MALVDLLPNYQSDWMSPGFLELVNQHLLYLQQTNPKIVSVTPHQGLKYNGDLFGLLDDLKVPKFFHYPVMLINGYTSSSDFGKEQVSGEFPSALLLPDENELYRLMNIYKT